MFSRFIIFLLLLSFWLLLSGHYTNVLIALGIASAGLVAWLCWRLNVIGAHFHTAGFYARLPAYMVWLFGVIIVSNVKVAVSILRPKLHINPGFRRVPASQTTDLGRLVHANSITLTPGTLSTDIDGDSIEVHTLLQSPDDEQSHREFDRRVRHLETGN